MKIKFLEHYGVGLLPKGVVMMFRLLYLIFGLDFGYTNFRSHKTKCFVKCVSFIRSVIVCVMFIVNCNMDYVTLNTLAYLNYIIVVLILLLSEKRSFCMLHEDLLAVDATLNVHNKFHDIARTLAILIAIFMLKDIMLFFALIEAMMGRIFNVVGLLSFYFLILTVDIIILVYFNLYYAAYCRIRKLTYVIEDKHNSVICCQHVYRTIILSVEKAKVPFDLVVSVHFAVGFEYRC